MKRDQHAPSAATGGASSRLLDYLSQGQEHAITARELVSKKSFACVRDVTQEVNRLRRSGVIICSSCTPPFGYYLPATREEVERFCRQMNSRITEISRAKDAAEELLKGGGAD